MVRTIFFIYNILSTSLENVLFKIKNPNFSSFIFKDGFHLLKIKTKIPVDIKTKRKIKVNKYMSKYVLNKTDINKIIFYLFSENKLKEYLENNLGFKFNINYIIAYQTLNIKKNEIEKGWYANHWHTDKAFSKNIIKVIIPFENIDKNGGGIQIFNKSYTNNNMIKKKDIKPFTFIGNVKNILVFNPNQCLHKAGNPISKSRSQMMIQLNPAKEWNFDQKLFEKQFSLEPKFPLLFNLIRKNKKMSWIS
jgi:hypothetical protein